MYQRFRLPFKCFRLRNDPFRSLHQYFRLPLPCFCFRLHCLALIIASPLTYTFNAYVLRLSPSNVSNVLSPSMLQPSNVANNARPSCNTSLPLPTMLLPPLSNPIPPSLPLSSHTCHRTSESIGLEAHPSSPQMLCAQSNF